MLKTQRIVERLNALAPEVLIGYASMIRMLAEEQLAGRLRITTVGPYVSNLGYDPAARSAA